MAKVFNYWGWSEIGIIYFGGGFASLGLAILYTSNAGIIVLLVLLNLMALPYTLFSVYYQAFVVKKWCPLCLLVQFALVLEFCCTMPELLELNIESISIYSFYMIALAFLIPTIPLLLVKPLLKKASKLEPAVRRMNTFLRNPNLFVSAITKKAPIDLEPFENELVFGNPDSNLTIVMASNLLCNPCKEAHKEIERLMMLYGEDARFVFRFVNNHFDGSDKNKAIKTLLSIKTLDSFAKSLSAWFESMDYALWSQSYPYQEDPRAEMLFNKNADWCGKEDIKFTPTIFINGYPLSMPYTYKDIKYHMKNLIENSLEEAQLN